MNNLTALLGPAIGLKSVIFTESVRLPGGSAQAHYIPSEDYPLTFYPQAGLIEARLKDRVQPGANFTRRNFYPKERARDMLIDEASLPPDLGAVRDVGGKLEATGQVRSNSDGTFERVTDDAPAEAPTVAAAPQGKAKKAKAPKGAPKAPPPPIDHPAAGRQVAPAGAGGPEGGA